MNDRKFNGSTYLDVICPLSDTSSPACNKTAKLEMFVITQQVSGEKVTNQGRMGLDYDKNNNQLSYLSYLNNNKMISKLMVTLYHDKSGYTEAIFGDRDQIGGTVQNDKTTWFSYTKNPLEDVRYIRAKNISFNNFKFNNNVTKRINIENTVTTLIYKAKNIEFAENFRTYLKEELTVDVNFNSDGPMIESIDFLNINCFQVEKKLGYFTITDQNGKSLDINITDFLVDVRQQNKNNICKFRMSILVHADE